MNLERINAALQKVSDTRSVTIGAGVRADVDRLFAQSFAAQPAVVVADETTFAVAGKEVLQRLGSAGRALAAPIVFPNRPTLYAEYQHVLALEQQLRAGEAIPIAVGSGTLNDITKLAAHRCGRPYMVVATAASMDGYTAFGAPITRDGFKQTFGCPAPRAVVADLDILAHAPPEMTAAGYADLLGKVTAGGDWLIADALEIEPIDPQAWALVQDSLASWTANPQLLQSGDLQAFERLIEGLIVVGIAMQIYRSSRPAAGCEHQFSHLWEMQEQTHGLVSHGFKVGIGSLAGAALYQRLVQHDLGALDIAALCRAWPERDQVEQEVRAAHPNPTLVANAVEHSLAKYIDAGALAQRLALLQERWPTLRDQLLAQVHTAAQLRELLRGASCPTEPSAIGVTLPQLKQSYRLARQIRSRYTVLDLAVETGCFGACMAELFERGGFWGHEPNPGGERAGRL